MNSPVPPLRILFFCSARQYVGEAARVVELAAALQHQGHAVEVICRRGYSVAAECRRLSIPCTEIHLDSRCTVIKELLDLRTIRSRIAAFRPDVLHAHRGKDHWLAALAQWRNRQMPLIRTRHVVTPIHPHRANRWLFGRATQALITVSQAVEEETEKIAAALPGLRKRISGGFSPDRLPKADPDAIEALRCRLNLPPTALVVGHLARLAPVKGQIHVLRAIPAVLSKHPQAIFLFAYNRKSGYYDLLLKTAAELGIEAAIRWIPDLDDLSAFLELCDVGLLPSVGSEGWSRATIEFQAFGKPVIATRVGCLEELILDGENGYLIEPRNSAMLSERLNRLLGDEALRQRFGQAARDRVLQNFTLDHTVNQVVSLYRQTLDPEETAEDAPKN